MDDLTPEQRARRVIDQKLEEAGWVVQNHKEIDLSQRFVAVRTIGGGQLGRAGAGGVAQFGLIEQGDG